VLELKQNASAAARGLPTTDSHVRFKARVSASAPAPAISAVAVATAVAAAVAAAVVTHHVTHHHTTEKAGRGPHRDVTPAVAGAVAWLCHDRLAVGTGAARAGGIPHDRLGVDPRSRRLRGGGRAGLARGSGARGTQSAVRGGWARTLLFCIKKQQKQSTTSRTKQMMAPRVPSPEPMQSTGVSPRSAHIRQRSRLVR